MRIMGRYTNWMIEMLKKRNRELETARREIVVRLGRAAEYRDNETGIHVIRMSNYSARWQGQSSSLKNNVTSSCRPARCTMWARSASVITSC